MKGEFDDPIVPLEIPGYDSTEAILPVEVANFLLITTALSRARPRLYDQKAKQWVYSSDIAAAVMFWPRDIGRRR